MDKCQLCLVRRFGHRALGGQMALEVHVRGIWLLTNMWPNLLTEPTLVQLCGVLLVLRGCLRGYFAGSILARFDPAKDSAK